MPRGATARHADSDVRGLCGRDYARHVVRAAPRSLAWSGDLRRLHALVLVRYAAGATTSTAVKNLAGAPRSSEHSGWSNRASIENRLQLYAKLAAVEILARYLPIVELTTALCTALAIGGGGWLVLYGRASLGTVSAFALYLLTCAPRDPTRATPKSSRPSGKSAFMVGFRPKSAALPRRRVNEARCSRPANASWSRSVAARWWRPKCSSWMSPPRASTRARSE